MPILLPSENLRAKEYSPLVGGISIGPENDAGTLGVILRTVKYGVCGLTALHVVQDGENTIVYQPSPIDKAGPSRSIGYVIETTTTGIDVALIQIRQDLLSHIGVVLGLNNPLRGFVSKSEILNLMNRPLQKAGRTTGVTRGRLIAGPSGSYDRITIELDSAWSKLSEDGDSGAIWMTLDGRAVAVHIDRSNTGQYAEAQPIFNLGWEFEMSSFPSPGNFPV